MKNVIVWKLWVLIIVGFLFRSPSVSAEYSDYISCQEGDSLGAFSAEIYVSSGMPCARDYPLYMVVYFTDGTSETHYSPNNTPSPCDRAWDDAFSILFEERDGKLIEGAEGYSGNPATTSFHLFVDKAVLCDYTTDTDGDGLSNRMEYETTHTYYDVRDSDGDEMEDGWEYDNGFDPLDDAGVNGADGDPDGDHFSNLDEFQALTDPWDVNDHPVPAYYQGCSPIAGSASTINEFDSKIYEIDADGVTTVAYSWFVDGIEQSEQDDSFEFVTDSNSSGWDTLSKNYHIRCDMESAIGQKHSVSWTVTVINLNRDTVITGFDEPIYVEVNSSINLNDYAMCTDMDNENDVPGDDNVLDVQFWNSSSEISEIVAPVAGEEGDYDLWVIVYEDNVFKGYKQTTLHVVPELDTDLDGISDLQETAQDTDPSVFNTFYGVTLIDTFEVAPQLYDLNNHGHVAMGVDGVGILYHDGMVTELDLIPYALNDVGDAVGPVSGSTEQGAYIDGVVTVLSDMYPMDINNQGVVVGYRVVLDERLGWMSYAIRSDEEFDLDNAIPGKALSINNAGHLLGLSRMPYGNGYLYVQNNFIDATQTVKDGCCDINEYGTIVFCQDDVSGKVNLNIYKNGETSKVLDLSEDIYEAYITDTEIILFCSYDWSNNRFNEYVYENGMCTPLDTLIPGQDLEENATNITMKVNGAGQIAVLVKGYNETLQKTEYRLYVLTPNNVDSDGDNVSDYEEFEERQTVPPAFVGGGELCMSGGSDSSANEDADGDGFIDEGRFMKRVDFTEWSVRDDRSGLLDETGSYRMNLQGSASASDLVGGEFMTSIPEGYTQSGAYLLLCKDGREEMPLPGNYYRITFKVRSESGDVSCGVYPYINDYHYLDENGDDQTEHVYQLMRYTATEASTEISCTFYIPNHKPFNGWNYLPSQSYTMRFDVYEEGKTVYIDDIVLEEVFPVDEENQDTDGDGMPDVWEDAYGLRADQGWNSIWDSDGDGLSNLEECRAGTNPLVSDTDGDGMPDGWELANGLDPLVDNGDVDSDQDGLTNLEEYEAGLDPLNPDSDGDGILDGDKDSDSDGVTDREELLRGTDPFEVNTWYAAVKVAEFDDIRFDVEHRYPFLSVNNRGDIAVLDQDDPFVWVGGEEQRYGEDIQILSLNNRGEMLARDYDEYQDLLIKDNGKTGSYFGDVDALSLNDNGEILCYSDSTRAMYVYNIDEGTFYYWNTDIRSSLRGFDYQFNSLRQALVSGLNFPMLDIHLCSAFEKQLLPISYYLGGKLNNDGRLWRMDYTGQIMCIELGQEEEEVVLSCGNIPETAECWLSKVSEYEDFFCYINYDKNTDNYIPSVVQQEELVDIRKLIVQGPAVNVAYRRLTAMNDLGQIVVLESAAGVAIAEAEHFDYIILTPMDRDTDSDGLLDYEEQELGLDLENPDTDGDGVSDADEVDGGTDPTVAADTDADGFYDDSMMMSVLDMEENVALPHKINDPDKSMVIWKMVENADIGEVVADAGTDGSDCLQFAVSEEDVVSPYELYVFMLKDVLGDTLPEPGSWYRVSFDGRAETEGLRIRTYWHMNDYTYETDEGMNHKHYYAPAAYLPMSTEWQTWSEVFYLPEDDNFVAWNLTSQNTQTFTCRLDLCDEGVYQIDNIVIEKVCPVE